jgi:hypothetical protein
MTRSALVPSCSIALLVALAGCDKAPEPVVEAKPAPPTAAAEPTEAAYTAEARVDLEGIATLVESGEVESATELEADLNAKADGLARVDIDADGELDELRIVEARAEKSTVFEVHAVPSSAKDVTAEAAPIVATVELTADANAGKVEARVALDASFKAVARIEGSGEVTRTLGGIAVNVDGRLEITHEAKPFVAWVFEPERPRYVAQVFIAKAEPPEEKDPCWPPGHCKHDLWKATGEEPPGHEKHDGDDDPGKAHEGDHGKPDKGDKDDKKDDKGDKDDDKPAKADKPDKKPDDAGKADKKPAKADKPDKKPDDAGKGDKGKPEAKAQDDGKGKGGKGK